MARSKRGLPTDKPADRPAAPSLRQAAASPICENEAITSKANEPQAEPVKTERVHRSRGRQSGYQ